jgi:hypothetical protein
MQGGAERHPASSGIECRAVTCQACTRLLARTNPAPVPSSAGRLSSGRDVMRDQPERGQLALTQDLSFRPTGSFPELEGPPPAGDPQGNNNLPPFAAGTPVGCPSVDPSAPLTDHAPGVRMSQGGFLSFAGGRSARSRPIQGQRVPTRDGGQAAMHAALHTLR